MLLSWRMYDIFCVICMSCHLSDSSAQDVLGAAGSRISVSDFPVWAELWQHLRGKQKRGLALAAVRIRLQCNAMQCDAMQRSAMYGNAMRCNVM